MRDTPNVPRGRLTRAVTGARVALVEAASGAGKTVLLQQVQEAIDGPLLLADLDGPVAGRGRLRWQLLTAMQRRSLTDLHEAFRAVEDTDPVGAVLGLLDSYDEPLMIAVDNAHAADDDLADLLRRVADGWPSPHRLIVTARDLPTTLHGLEARPDVTFLDGTDLAFRPDETVALLTAIGPMVPDGLSEQDARALTTSTHGWAAALALACQRLERAGRTAATDEIEHELTRLLSGPITVASLVDELLDDLTTAQAAALRQLAQLSAFDETLTQVANVAGGLAGLRAAGLPVRQVHDGWFTFPAAVGEALVQTTPADVDLSKAAAARHLAEGDAASALRILDAPGLHEELAKALTELRPRLVPELDPGEHASAVAALGEVRVRAHPRVLLGLADNWALSGHTVEQRDAILRAGRLVDDRPDDDPDRLEIEAATLALHAPSPDADTVADARRLLARPDLPPMSRGRAEVAIGRALATSQEPAHLRAAGHHLAHAARRFARLDAPAHATTAYLWWATASSWPLGRFEAALGQLQQALAAAGHRLRARVAVLPFQAFVLIDAGRYTEAEGILAELRRAARLVADERAGAYARWAMARLASQSGDLDATRVACAAVARSSAVIDPVGGAWFRTDAAQLLARVGDLTTAEAYLADVRHRDPGGTPHVAMSELVVAAYAGESDRARAALATLRASAVAPRERWRITMLHAHVARRDDDPLAATLAATAFEEAAQLGRPDLPLVREPAMAAALLDLAAHLSPEAAELARATPRRLRLFGAQVVVADRSHHLAVTGRCAQLLAYLGLHGPSVRAETVIEALWPDGDPTRGRSRLRTVLARTRREAGDLVERLDEALRLRDGVSVDVAEFRRLYRESMADTAPDGGRGAATSALAIYDRRVAVEFADLDWVRAGSRQLRRAAVALHDRLARQAERDDRTDDAIRACEAAIALEPTDEHRHLMAARLLAVQGRRARALDLLAQARAALTELGLPASDDLERLEAYLERTAAA